MHHRLAQADAQRGGILDKGGKAPLGLRQDRLIAEVPERADQPWNPATTASGEIVPGEKAPPDRARPGYALPSNTEVAAVPPPPPGVVPPPQWGDPNIVRQRLGGAVKDILFDRAVMQVFALSPAHHRAVSERSAGPLVRLVAELSGSDPAKLAEFRRQYDALAAEYFEDNIIRQDYLISRATKL